MSEHALVLARASDAAADRIGAARPAHLELLRAMAARGELLLGVPLLDAAGAYRGSMMLVAAAALEDYLAAEPFRRQGVWADHETHPFRVAPLPYHPLPQDGPVPSAPTHSIAIAWDGRDEAAAERRLAVRGAHLARVRPAAEDGTLVLGGAVLDAGDGRMVGSVAVTAHPTTEAAKAWWAADPYVTGGVWRDVAWHATRIAPLPYRPLPGARATPHGA